MSDSSDSRDTALTERQRTILEVIRSSVTNRGYPPSIREIGDAVGLTSTSSVAHQLRTLERKGYLRRAAIIASPTGGSCSRARSASRSTTRSAAG